MSIKKVKISIVLAEPIEARWLATGFAAVMKTVKIILVEQIRVQNASKTKNIRVCRNCRVSINYKLKMYRSNIKEPAQTFSLSIQEKAAASVN